MHSPDVGPYTRTSPQPPSRGNGSLTAPRPPGASPPTIPGSSSSSPYGPENGDGDYYSPGNESGEGVHIPYASSFKAMDPRSYQQQQQRGHQSAMSMPAPPPGTADVTYRGGDSPPTIRAQSEDNKYGRPGMSRPSIGEPVISNSLHVDINRNPSTASSLYRTTLTANATTRRRSSRRTSSAANSTLEYLSMPHPSSEHRGPLELHPEYYDGEIAGGEGVEDDFDGGYSDLGADEFANFALLSHIAVRLRDKVPRGTHVKGSVPYPKAFTGKDIVSTIQAEIQRDLLVNHGISTNDRRAALQVARSLQSQLFFYEVEWGGRILQDGVEDVYMFLDDQAEGSSSADQQPREREELPTGVITALTQCYSPSCWEGEPCYSFTCPLRKTESTAVSKSMSDVGNAEKQRRTWTDSVDPLVLESLPDSEIRRQT